MSANEANCTSDDTAAIRALLGRLAAAFQNTKHRRLLEAVTFRFQPNSKPLAGR